MNFTSERSRERPLVVQEKKRNEHDNPNGRSQERTFLLILQ